MRNYDNVGNQIARDDSTSNLPRTALRMRLNYDLRGFLAAFVVLNRFSRKPSVHTSSIDKKHLYLVLNVVLVALNTEKIVGLSFVMMLHLAQTMRKALNLRRGDIVA